MDKNRNSNSKNCIVDTLSLNNILISKPLTPPKTNVRTLLGTFSDSDETRIKPKWDDMNENLLKEWLSECNIKSKQHYLKAHRNKKLYNIFGVPLIVLPIVLGVVQEKINDPLIISILLCIIGLFNGLNLFFNFSKKKMEHFNSMGEYKDLALSIHTILNKQRKHRQAVDVIIEATMIHLSNINNNSLPL